MKTVTPQALDAAEQFLLLNARLIDRLRFARMFRGGSADAVLAALAPYANPDGGFGQALEPDLRGVGSQPQHAEVALRLLDEVAGEVAGDVAGERPFDGPLVRDVCDYLATISTPEGGVPFVLPSVRETPAAPWWIGAEDFTANLNPTAAIAGLLHKHGVTHPFLDRASEFCWRSIESLEDVSDYTALAILPFLDHSPDRDRAEATFERLAPAIRAVVALDPQTPGHVHFPLDFAPVPGGFGSRLVADDVIEAHLDVLVDAQGEDGSWAANWEAWAPITVPEWSGFITVGQLRTLRAYGRL